MRKDIWKDDWKLTEKNDEQMQRLTGHMCNETNGSTDWHSI
jgi:hypothetical protein